MLRYFFARVFLNKQGEGGGGNYAVSVQLILSLLTGAAGSFSTFSTRVSPASQSLLVFVSSPG